MCIEFYPKGFRKDNTAGFPAAEAAPGEVSVRPRSMLEAEEKA